MDQNASNPTDAEILALITRLDKGDPVPWANPYDLRVTSGTMREAAAMLRALLAQRQNGAPGEPT